MTKLNMGAERRLLSLRSVCLPAHRNPHSADLQNGQLHLPLVGFLIRLADPSRRLSDTCMHYPVRLPGALTGGTHFDYLYLGSYLDHFDHSSTSQDNLNTDHNRMDILILWQGFFSHA